MFECQTQDMAVPASRSAYVACCTLNTHERIAYAHTHTIHQYRHASIAYRFPHTLHHSDEPSACTFIIFIQVLALSHRAQVSTWSRSKELHFHLVE